MATKTYKCTNYGDCDLALSKEMVEIEDGEDVICPGCSKNSLVESGSEKKAGATGIGKKLFIVGAAVVLVAVVLVWALRPVENADLANTMLSSFFPKLPK